MSEFYHIQQYDVSCDDADDYLNVMGMIVSELRFKRQLNGTCLWSFDIIQSESSGVIQVEYISSCVKEDLKLAQLLKMFGTLIFMNNCVRTPNGLSLEIWDEMAIVAFRPNVYQVNQFLKESIKYFISINYQ